MYYGDAKRIAEHLFDLINRPIRFDHHWDEIGLKSSAREQPGSETQVSSPDRILL
jgi:hypothetical protein